MKRLMGHDESATVLVGDDWALAEGARDITPAELPAGLSYPCGNYVSTIMPSFDFETYSEAGYVIDERTGKVRGLSPQGKGGLPVVGTPVYAEHPSTRVVCLYYDLKDSKGNRGWIPGTPTPQDLLDHIGSGRMIEAWNITFEWYIWNMICVRQFGWPPLQLDQCYCAMAKSRRHSMPGGLGNAAKVLGTPLKDKEGTRLINKLSRPVSATKNRPLPYWDFTNAWDDYKKFYSYCADDVRAEDGAAALIPDLTPYERATWLTDQTINARGVRVDMVALHAMQRIMDEMFAQYVAELKVITNGAVDSASKVAALGEWLGTQGVHMDDMKADTVDEKLEELEAEGWTENVAYRALQIRSILSSANIKKIPTLLLRVSSDGRLRDQYSYCGADRTGRWSAGGVQLQNITAKGPKSAMCEGCDKHFNPRDLKGCPRCGSTMFHKMNDWTVEAVMDAKQDLINNNLAFVEHVWGDPATVLCGCLRGLFVAKEGTRFICCDFSAIEAVIAACLARCQWRIDVFQTHGKIYEMSASKITGTPLEEYVAYKEQNGFDHPDRKKIGKVAELACFTRDTQVLTKRGYVRMVEVTKDDFLWDGVEWVTSDGVVAKGERQTLVLDGVRVTPDHPVSLNGSWTEARKLASNPSTLSQALATGSANLPSCATRNKALTVAQYVRVLVGWKNSTTSLTSSEGSLRGALNAVVRKALRRAPSSTQSTPMLCLTPSTVEDSSIGSEPLSRGATAPTTNSFTTMVVEALRSSALGEERKVQGTSCSTSETSKVGTSLNWRWTASTLMETMSRATSVLSQNVRTALTSVASLKCKNELTTLNNVYDIVNAGPRHRFTIKTDSGHLLVHNSGYGGWIGAYRNFGADGTDDEIKAQVLGWREASPEIEHMWGGQFVQIGPKPWNARPELYGLEGMAIMAILNPGQQYWYNDIAYHVHQDILYCRLPSGRFLTYHRPRLIDGDDKLKRGPCYKILFEGWNSNSQKGKIGWHVLETYGGRLFENICQAVGADIQAECMVRLEQRGYPIAMHTHDEAIAEMQYGFGSIEEMCDIMSERPEWCQWWPIKAAGWEHEVYQKD